MESLLRKPPVGAFAQLATPAAPCRSPAAGSLNRRGPSHFSRRSSPTCSTGGSSGRRGPPLQLPLCGYDQVPRLVPPGSLEHHENEVLRGAPCDFGPKEGHPLGTDVEQHQRPPCALGRRDGGRG